MRDRLLEQLAIKIEADRDDVAALRGAENVARAANLQIAHGDVKAGAERAVLLDRVDPFARRADRHHLARQQEIGIGLVLGAADAAAQLVEIGQPEPVGAVDDDRVRVRNIEAALDDRRADQHVDLAGDEACHHVFEFVRVHLAVADSTRASGQSSAMRSRMRSIDLHAVVQEIDLALAFELAIDRVANDPLVVAADDRLDRQPIERRRFDRATCRSRR